MTTAMHKSIFKTTGSKSSENNVGRSRMPGGRGLSTYSGQCEKVGTMRGLLGFQRHQCVLKQQYQIKVLESGNGVQD